MTSIVADEAVAKFARHQNDMMARMLKGSLDFEEIMRVNQEVIDRGGFVTVDRTILPSYPGWMKEVVYPELEATGPTQFNVGTLTQWPHDDQKTSVVAGDLIHEYLKSNQMFEGCLGLRDLEEIQKKGIAFFRKYFQGKTVFGWKSVVRGSDGDLGVPCLLVYDGEVILDWRWAGADWGSNDPALRFA